MKILIKINNNIDKVKKKNIEILTKVKKNNEYYRKIDKNIKK